MFLVVFCCMVLSPATSFAQGWIVMGKDFKPIGRIDEQGGGVIIKRGFDPVGRVDPQGGGAIVVPKKGLSRIALLAKRSEKARLTIFNTSHEVGNLVVSAYPGSKNQVS